MAHHRAQAIVFFFNLTGGVYLTLTYSEMILEKGTAPGVSTGSFGI